MARLLTKYKDEVIATMMESFSFKNQMAVPKIDKIVEAADGSLDTAPAGIE